MSAVRVIFAREFGRLWAAPATVAAVGTFLLLAGGAFVNALVRGDGGSVPVPALWAVSAAPFLPLLAALLTMRAVAEDRARVETMLTAPVREREIAAGMFGAAFAVAAAALAAYLLMPLVALPLCAPALADRLTLARFAPTFAALLLQTAAWCALGLFASACCRTPAVAAVATLLAVSAVPQALFRAGAAWSPAFRAVFADLPAATHLTDVATDLYALAPVVRYAATACFGLFAAAKALSFRRLGGRGARGVRLSGVCAVLLAAAFAAAASLVAERLGVAFEVPPGAADGGASARTRQILADAHGTVRVTCFLHANAPERRPVTRMLRGLEAAARAVAGTRLEIEWIDPRWDIGPAADLAARGTPEGTLVFSRGHRRVLVPAAALFTTAAGDGAVATGAAGVFVGEEVCASAIQRLARPVSRETVYWTSGHGEGSFDSYDPVTGFSDIARDLRNDGYRLAHLDLSAVPGVPEDCAALVIAGAREPFSRTETARLGGWLASGGRLLALATGVPNAGAGALLADWGVRRLPFTAVSPRTLTGADVAVTDFADHPVTAPLKGGTARFSGAAVLASSVADAAAPDADRTVFTPLARTDASAWGESDVTVHPWLFDPTTEPRGPLVLAAALERGGDAAKDLAIRPTRIVVIGDAAFVANGALATRAGANRDLFLNALAWLAGYDTLTASRTPADVVVTGLDRRGWIAFAARAALVVPIFALLVALTVLPGRLRRI